MYDRLFGVPLFSLSRGKFVSHVTSEYGENTVTAYMVTVPHPTASSH